MATLISEGSFFLDSFALRQWSEDFAGTQMAGVDQQAFVRRVAEFHEQGSPLVDGYAPFCKHLFIPNEWGATVSALPITDNNRHLLQSGYTRRRPEEMAVLTRWFPASAVSPLPAAKHLDIILYSREQLIKEYEAMPTKDGGKELLLVPGAPWGIISIKAQDEDYETPMQPITMWRNCMISEGGSGVELDRQKYEESVAYWDAHAAIQ